MLAAVGAATAVWLSFRPGPVAPGPTSPSGRWWQPVLAVVAGGLLVVGPVLGLAVLVGWAGRRLLAVRAERRVAEATARRVLETCELLAAEVTAGQPPAGSLARAAADWSALGPVAEAGALGGDVPRAMRELASRPGAAELRLVAAAWTVAHRTGAGLADALGRVATAIRADRATRRVVESELASARATARLIAALPLLVLLLGSGSGAASWRFLVATPVGTACLAGGLALGLLGLWWIERIADGVTR